MRGKGGDKAGESSNGSYYDHNNVHQFSLMQSPKLEATKENKKINRTPIAVHYSIRM